MAMSFIDKIHIAIQCSCQTRDVTWAASNCKTGCDRMQNCLYIILWQV